MSMIEQVFIKEEVFLEGEEDDDDDDDDDEVHNNRTPDVLELENNSQVDSEKVPQFSRALYWNVYNAFKEWMDMKNEPEITSDVLVAYFKELSKKYKPPSLWSKYSMLKRTVQFKHKIDIHDFTALLEFLKDSNKGYEPKKSEVLTVKDVKRFLRDGPDYEFLSTKVALIIALFGGCRLCDLVNLANNDVEQHGQIIKITLRNRKNNTIKTFIIEGEMLQPILAYRSLRPKQASDNRFFLSYRNGRCINMPLGKNKFGTMPKEIAQFLELPNPELYTGHSFRRSSVSLCKEQGISVADLKKLNGFRKTKVAPEKKKEESSNHKRPVVRQVECVNPGTSQKHQTIEPVEKKPRIEEVPVKPKATPAPLKAVPLQSNAVPATSKTIILKPNELPPKLQGVPLKLIPVSSEFIANLKKAKAPTSNEKLILYSYWRSSCSYRVRIALNLKEIPYEIKPINLEKGGGEQNGDEFRKINPMARVPALHIDNHTLIESLNILQYLEETRPQHPLMPEDPLQRSRVREICDLIASGIQPLQNTGVFNHLMKDQQKDWAQFWITRGFLAIEELLSQRAGKYCVGDDITLADCCLIPQVYNARKFRVDLNGFPRIVQIDKTLESHPAFIAAHPDNQPDCPKKK